MKTDDVRRTPRVGRRGTRARESGKKLRTTVLPAAPRLMGADDVRALREYLNASQAVFAHLLNVSTKLVQAWESSRRRPAGAALRLLEIAERDPRAVFQGLALPDLERPAKRPTVQKVTTRAHTPVPSKRRTNATKSAKRKLTSA